MLRTEGKKIYIGNMLFKFSCFQILALSSILIFSNPVSAQIENPILDLPLDQLVNVELESASRFKQKSSEAPSAVEVLTAENIRSYGWRTLADALNSIRGL